MEDRARIRIDTSSGVLEVEGSEPFVREMFDSWQDLLKERPTASPSAGQTTDKPKARAPRRRPAKPATEAKPDKPNVSDLDESVLRELAERRDDLRSYLDERKTRSNVQEVAAIARFLWLNFNIELMDERHYVAALKALNKAAPKFARQVLVDAKNKKGFFYSEGSTFRLTPIGVAFADQDSLKVKATSDG